MKNSTLDKLAWVLIFGGGLALAFGLALLDFSAAGGRSVVVVGSLAIAVGVLLVWLRSRRDPPPPRKNHPDRKGNA